MQLSKITLNVVDAVQTLLNLLNTKVTRTAIINEIEKHPYIDTLLGIGDLLSNWNISNTARQIEREELKILRGPFIGYLSSNNSEFVVIDRISDSGITIIDKHGMTKVYLFENFINEWSGIYYCHKPIESKFQAQSDFFNFSNRLNFINDLIINKVIP